MTHSLADALRGAELVVCRDSVARLPRRDPRGVARSFAPGAVIVSATKGLEAATLLRMSEVIARKPATAIPVVVLSGPSFAIEVARQLPTAVLAASFDAQAIELVQHEFRGPYFRLYGSDDVIGVEIGARAEEHDRHRRRRGRRAGARPQRAGGADHARLGGDSRVWPARPAAGAKRWPA